MNYQHSLTVQEMSVKIEQLELIAKSKDNKMEMIEEISR